MKFSLLISFAVLAVAAGCAPCPTGSTQCGSICVDMLNDNANCGACKNACGAGTACSAGACAVTISCQAPLTQCGNICQDLQNDNAHCGACGNTCDAGMLCALGGCVTACPTGLT